MSTRLFWLLLAALTFRVQAAEPLAFYELRIYDVAANKIETAVERLQEVSERARKNPGVIDELGCWSAIEAGGTLVSLRRAPIREAFQLQEFADGKLLTIPMHAEPDAKLDFIPADKPRAFDLRIYSVPPAKLAAFLARWRDYAVPIYERHGLRSLGWWLAENEAEGANRRFVCLLAGESAAAIQKSIAAFHADPEWQRVEKETEINGKLRSGVTAYKLTPANSLF